MLKVYTVLVFVLFGLSATAQTLITGTIKTKPDGLVLAGATIIPNQNSQLAIISDEDGKFSLNLSKDEGSIAITFMGMITQVVNYRGNMHIDVAMEYDVNMLEEVVMIGYGTSKKGDITTAATNVQGVESISDRAVTTVNDFLQGATPGVTVLQQGGDPTSTGKIVIRGLGSLANESPLMVVDGMPYYGPPINPYDIESITILKDAASAAIYGAQAASGVIVINTKRGKSGKPLVSVNAYTGFQQAVNLPTPLTAKQQSTVYNLAADNAGADRLSAHNSELNPWGQVNRTNWVDAVFRDAMIYNGNVAITGATEHLNYLGSFNYQKKEGLLLGTGFERFALRLKADYSISDKLSIGENVSFSRTEAIGTNTSSSYSGSVINALYMPSAAPVYDEEGNFHGTAPYELSQFAGAYGDVYNPVALLLRPYKSSPINYLDANTYAKYEFIPGLSLKSSFSFSTTSHRGKTFSPRVPELGRTNNQNFLYQNYSNTNRWIWENQLAYKRSFGKHNLDLTAIFSAQKTDYEYFSQEGRDFSSEEPFNQYMGNAGEFMPSVTDVYQDALTSAIARGMYNYDSRYYLTASIRRDKTSRLATGNQSDIFPSVSMGWNLSNESFFQSDFINSLKLRASWGQIGNINSVGYYSFDVPLGTDYSILGEGAALAYKGVYVKRQSNPDLVWETSESIDIGIDASFLEGRMEFTADYFSKKTIGMIIPGLPDVHQGVGAPDVNGGSISNKGVELSLGFRENVNALTYSLRANFSVLNNTLEDLDGYNKNNINYIAHSDNVRSTLNPYRSVVGRSLYSTYLVPYEGIFQTEAEVQAHIKDGSLIQPYAQPGDFKFTDVNNDGKISEDDRVFMDSYQPDLTYSFTGSFEYKRFDFGVLFQGVAGVQVFNGYKFTAYNASQSGYNLDNRVLDAWSPENTDADIPRLSTKDDNRNFGTASSWYLEDASYLRLKNVTLGYTFPSLLRVYLSSENVLTFTKYSGLDPEVGGKGLDVARYPLARSFTAGVSFKF